MMKRIFSPVQNVAAWMLTGAVLALCGCGAPPPQFKLNRVYTLKEETTANFRLGDRTAEVADVLAALFGTPDKPHVPKLQLTDDNGNPLDTGAVLDIDRLRMAAGPVSSDAPNKAQGLYREHCAHCHGVTGDGRGPTAEFLNPYPRDYRKGQYKFKSTPIGERPTHDDLTKIIKEGIPGTAMPSFKLLPNDELDAVVHYVKYLSIRGEVERLLVTAALQSESDPLIGTALKDSTDPEKIKAYEQKITEVKEMAGETFVKWAKADGQALASPGFPETKLTEQESIDRGREIFYGVANCNKCHGDSALGDGQLTDYDDWTKEYMEKPAMLPKFLEVGALPPRNIRPRNLRQGAYRGGRSPLDIYWRVMNGIEGTPMPGMKANVLEAGAAPDPKKLTQEDVWHLIRYVRNLPYEDVSRGKKPAHTLEKERN